MTDSPHPGTPKSTSIAASPEEAGALLAAAASGIEVGSAVSRSTRNTERGFAIVLGLCISLFLMSVVYIYPLAIPLLTIAVTILYAAGIVAAILMFTRLHRATSAGWSTRYIVGFISTMVLYVGGVALFSATGITTPALWAPYAIATALPVIIASFAGPRR
jgi:hypothetical protein